MKKNIFGIVVAVIIVSGVSFYTGFSYGKTKTSDFNLSSAFGEGQVASARGFSRAGRVLPGRGGMGGVVSGEIISKDDTSITVKIGDTQGDTASASGNQGGSKIVLFSNSTDIGKSAKAVSDELSVGTLVMVNGTANSDGSITAKSIQIRLPLPVSR